MTKGNAKEVMVLCTIIDTPNFLIRPIIADAVGKVGGALETSKKAHHRL